MYSSDPVFPVMLSSASLRLLIDWYAALECTDPLKSSSLYRKF